MPNDIEALKARLREEIARIIDPVSFSMTPEHYDCTSEDFKRTMAYGGQLAALEKADAILALVLDQLSARIQELEGALSFYAQIENWNDGVLLEHIASSAEADFGHIARAALSGGDGNG